LGFADRYLDATVFDFLCVDLVGTIGATLLAGSAGGSAG